MIFIEEKISVLTDVLRRMIGKDIDHADGFEYVQCEYKENNTPPDRSAEWKAFNINDRIGGRDCHFWFHKKFTTPSMQENKELVFSLVTSGDGGWDAKNPQCIIYLNGKMIQGMDINHTEMPLEYDSEYDMYIYLYVGMIDCLIDFKPSLKTIDKKIECLYYDLSVPLDSARCFEQKDERYIKIIKHLELAVGFLDLRQSYSEAFYQSIDAAIEYLDKEFYNGICGGNEAVVNCIGHTHIDVAWLWTINQTREKAQRSFATVLNLMKQYPEYKFMSSQPQLYKYVKESAPEIYEEIKQRVQEGRWEVEGAMWLEADCNLSSGESLVRQIMFGKRFMKEEFGVESKILWLPDVFGYSAALPQILKKSGVEKFVTSKISWNEFNKMPYDTFLWEGIDGTDIFTYFITAQDKVKQGDNDIFTTYVGYIRPKQVIGTWERYQQKHYNNETMITFGFGDGGGGPTKDMLEQQRRLAYGILGMPKTKIEFAADFLNTVETNFKNNCTALKRTPKWVGELYLELHRGTYTSIAKNKKNNRKSELLFQKAEALSVIDGLLLDGYYPQYIINNNWETILLNQFHDIIPGSSILEVYEECDRQYSQILEAGQEITDKKIANISSNIKTDGGLFVYNPLSFPCSDVVNYRDKKVFVCDVPAFGWKVVKPEEPKGNIKLTNSSMENKFYALQFDEKSNIASIFDKTYNREVIKVGEAANELQAFEDYPKCYDAWEITNYYKQKMWTIDEVVSVKQVNEGARAGLEITKKFLNSTIKQTIYLYQDLRKIDFENEIDWQEEHILLKAAFPFGVHSDKATYDIQFGNVERPTHTNTSWDAAKFEVCAHKFADISEDNYGVSLINDCKYGYSAEGSTLKLTLLKCATYPNPQADKGNHRFTYSIYPHSGNFKEGKTINAAYALNQPMLVVELEKQNGTLPEKYSFISCDSENIIAETVKKAEDSDDVIVRLYETYNRKGNVKLDLGFDVKKAYICDLMENNISEIECNDNSITLLINTYEIVTVKLCGCKKS